MGHQPNAKGERNMIIFLNKVNIYMVNNGTYACADIVSDIQPYYSLEGATLVASVDRWVDYKDTMSKLKDIEWGAFLRGW